MVVGDAPPGARLALVGEAPGAEEDRTGRPFVGKAGVLLDRLLAEAGLDRAAVAVVNVLQCRPPGNRTPTATEATRCRGWLERKLDLVGPELVVALGLSAAPAFLGRGSAGGRPGRGARGRPPPDPADLPPVRGHPVRPERHPVAALRTDLGRAPPSSLRRIRTRRKY